MLIHIHLKRDIILVSRTIIAYILWLISSKLVNIIEKLNGSLINLSLINLLYFLVSCTAPGALAWEEKELDARK